MDITQRTAQTDVVLYALDNHVAQLTLNRPESLNSLDLATVEALLSSVSRALEEGAHVITLTGAGRAFCSGADLSGALGLRDENGEIDLGSVMRTHYHRLMQVLSELPIPLVTGINGIAAGGGMSLALCADIAIAGRSAQFRQTFVDIGLIPDMGATAILPRTVGRARARGLALLGNRIDAEKALHWGMVWELVEDAELSNRVREVAESLAKKSPQTLREICRALDRGTDADIVDQLNYETTVQDQLGRQPAFALAVERFLGKNNR